VYFLAGRFAEAEKYARAGLHYSYENPWLANALGAILVSQSRHEEALPYLDVAIKGFTAMGPAGWGSAYPGNDPRIYDDGQRASLRAAEDNRALALAVLNGDGDNHGTTTFPVVR
jgi:hypothetical protein